MRIFPEYQTRLLLLVQTAFDFSKVIKQAKFNRGKKFKVSFLLMEKTRENCQSALEASVSGGAAEV